MAVQSKLLVDAAINCSCHKFVHPWTASCICAAGGILVAAVPSCLRTYSTVYFLALLARLPKLPTLEDLKRTIYGILQSTAFLATNSYLFSLCVCWTRLILGRFYFSTVAFVPTFIASFAALSIERPERRAPLAFYVANVGLETLWKMLEARGLVRSIPNGQVMILGVSLSALLYLYRAGLHKTVAKDFTFKGLRLIVGPEEEGPLTTTTSPVTTAQSARPVNFSTISGLLHVLDRICNGKHRSCPHSLGCVSYALMGGLKPFLGGLGLQVGLKLLLNIRNIIGFKMQWREKIFNANNLRLGLTLGSFPLLYKVMSCALRHCYGYDSASFAIPAGLVASVGLLQFPHTTPSLYIMWKTLQLLYNWGIAEKKLPEVPHFTMYLYAFFTALLFHAAILEARTVRPSYFKFLRNTSGKRLLYFNVRDFDVYGLQSHDQLHDVIKSLKIDMSAPHPITPMIV